MWSYRVPSVAFVASLYLWTVQGFMFVPGVAPSSKLRRSTRQGGLPGINYVLGASHALRFSMTGADVAEGSIVETHFTGAGTVLVSSPYEFNRQGKEACILLWISSLSANQRNGPKTARRAGMRMVRSREM